MIGFVMIAAAVLILFGVVRLAFVQGRRVGYLAAAEYWVYFPEAKLPKQDEVTDLVLKGTNAIGPKEGMLFSDVRLHIGLVLRSKNPHIFRPDLFEEHIEPTAENLAALADSNSLAKIRYLSEQPLPDNRHLQLLPYLAYAYAKLGNSKVIFDVNAERLMSMNDLKQMLKQDSNASRAEAHVRIVWTPGDVGLLAKTKGMVKAGLPELTTNHIEPDEQLLVHRVLEEGVKAVWDERRVPEQANVHAYEDNFRLLFKPLKTGEAEVTILRVQPN